MSHTASIDFSSAESQTASGSVSGSHSHSHSHSGATPRIEGELLSYESSSEENHAIAKELGLTHLDNIYTERFQVDGRRLQRMLESDSEVKGVSKAEMFFEDIMKATETYISWPKEISEDTNKANEPCVHVYGKQDDISWAKGLILSILSTRDKRLKLRIIIPNNDHRFIVGRDNNNLTRIMESTDTIVELPYSNQRNMAQKGNQVTIEGSLDGIERARMNLRASMPLLMSFEIPSNQPEPCVDLVKEKFNIQVILTEQTNSTLVFVKGSLKRVDVVKEAIRELISSTFNKYVPRPLVSVQMEIPPLYQDFVKGEDNTKLLDIMEDSKTKIFFPDLTINGNTKQRSQVTIIGTIEGVCKARHQLVENFPIELIFDIPGHYQANATDILNIGTQFGVCITLAQKENDSGLTVTIKGIEKYIQKIYEVYQDIMGLRSVVPDTGEVPKAFYLLEAAYQRVMGELVHKYIESVVERTNYAAAQFQGITNYGCGLNYGDVSYGYIQAAQTNRELEQFCTTELDPNPIQGQTTYSPDSGHDSETAFQPENQPKDWILFGLDTMNAFGNFSLESGADKTDGTTSNDFVSVQEDQPPPPYNPSSYNYGGVYTGSAAPGAERHILAEMRNSIHPANYPQ